MKNLSKLILGTTLACSFGGLAQQAYAVNLPTCTPGLTCLQFGDFNVYSLPLLDLQNGGDGVPKPGTNFYAPSTYGAIKNDTILGINNGNSTTTGNPPTTTDGSYNTPSPNNTTNQTFSTATAADPAGGPSTFGAGAASGDKASWDTTVSALQTLVGGATKPVVAFFAFNETGSGTGLLTTDLLVWARVTLYNYTAANIFTTGPSFYLSGDGSTNVPDETNLPAANGTDANGTLSGTPAGFGSWVYVHAGICVNGTSFVGFPDVNGSCAYLGAGATSANQNNLGQNAAAFAINSPLLDAALQTGQWNTFSLDWKMGYINGGGETAWIMPAGVNADCPPGSTDPICLPILPEPKTLALLGIALLGLAASRRSVLRRRG